MFADNACYVGEFANDWIEGSGCYTWSDGAVYDGEWTRGRMEGKGEYRTVSGASLSGTFINNLYLDVIFICASDIDRKHPRSW